MAPKLLLVAALANAWQFNPVKRPQKLHATTLRRTGALAPRHVFKTERDDRGPCINFTNEGRGRDRRQFVRRRAGLRAAAGDFGGDRGGGDEGFDEVHEVTAGTGELRSAIARDLKERKHVEYDPGEIVVANGAKQAVYEALMALCGPGDDAILPAPYWVSYPSMVDMCGATYTTVSTSIDDGFALTLSSYKML